MNYVSKLLAFAITLLPGVAATTAQDARPKFEVASIKRNQSPTDSINMARQPGGRFVATGVTVKLLTAFAYQIPDTAVVGGPKCLNSDRWDIEARAVEHEEGADAITE